MNIFKDFFRKKDTQLDLVLDLVVTENNGICVSAESKKLGIKKMQKVISEEERKFYQFVKSDLSQLKEKYSKNDLKDMYTNTAFKIELPPSNNIS